MKNIDRHLIMENVPGELQDKDPRYADPEFVRWMDEKPITTNDLNKMFTEAMTKKSIQSK
jgi:hypothetical protein